ncbi:DUF2867 domain-containing protein [Streptomyces sp. NPDC058612]|uniref:DUF2867 domain-containing protein n=1 Tax=Streptomyces sp. NPDC058612 TaxID=3346555 RepID=UPI003667C003
MSPLRADLQRYVQAADHIDQVHARAAMSLRECVSVVMSWRPWWLKALLLARRALAQMLRINHPVDTATDDLLPDRLSFINGDKIAFFTVTAADEEEFVVLTAADTHLTVHLVVNRERTGPGPENTFRFLTVVHYHRWTGPLYFNLIRPFHRLIMRRLIAAVTNYERSPG